MTFVKFSILRRIHKSHASDPVRRTDLLVKGRVLKTDKAIKELLSDGSIRLRGNSDILRLTDLGISRYESFRFTMLNFAISITAVVISVIALLKP